MEVVTTFEFNYRSSAKCARDANQTLSLCADCKTTEISDSLTLQMETRRTIQFTRNSRASVTTGKRVLALSYGLGLRESVEWYLFKSRLHLSWGIDC